jgi:prolyl oligopeptidase
MAHTVNAPPITQVEPITEIVHGIKITDPYRWLEDQHSSQTRKWLEDQAGYTRAHLVAIPDRAGIRERVAELLRLNEVISAAWNVGDSYLFSKRRGNEEQPVIVMKDGLSGPETVLVNPAARGTGESTSVGIVAISDNARFLAYSVRQGGADHSALEILDIENDRVLPDRLAEGSCTGFVFAGDGSGFYYSHRELHDSHPHYRAVLWHRFGSNRSQDQEIFFAGEAPNLFLGILHSSEADLLAYFVSSSGKLDHTSIYLQRTLPEVGDSQLLLREIEGCFVPFFAGGRMFAYTDLAAPNFRIVRIDLTNPEPSLWHDVVPESGRRIQQFAVAAESIFVSRIDRFSTEIEVFSLCGHPQGPINFPRDGTINLQNGPPATEKLFYNHTSISKPTSLNCYDPRTSLTFEWGESRVELDPVLIAVDEVEYTSKDGTTVPLFLAARKGLLHSGPLPTFLTGYGGFGSCVPPRYTAFATFLMEQGFLFAVPALRGGSELGEQWHLAGKKEKRQNSFDDFIAAVEWLILKGQSERGRIAIGGGSNAGLLVGAVITQRPDLFRAAICLGPLLDMTRYHRFDSAAGWADEYGSPEDEDDFRFLLSYSPYQHVRNGTTYPAMLFISGDADTRCNPMHTRKMVARLQAANASDHHILLDYKREWGHTPVQPLSRKIDALTDRLAFVCHELGVPIRSKGSA